MKCAVCGQDYGVTHNCPGVAAAPMIEEEAAPPPEWFSPLYYLRLAIKIVRWDEVSIRRASRDPNAIYYGVGLWAAAALVILLFTVLPRMLRAGRLSNPEAIIRLWIGLSYGLLLMGLITFVQLGLCHLIAKWFFGATGTLLGVMRPLLLGWFVNVLILVPVAGLWVGGIAWIAVLMLVFEEVDGIGRLQAFLIAAGINICFMVFQFAIGMRQA